MAGKRRKEEASETSSLLTYSLEHSFLFYIRATTDTLASPFRNINPTIGSLAK